MFLLVLSVYWLMEIHVRIPGFGSMVHRKTAATISSLIQQSVDVHSWTRPPPYNALGDFL